MIERCVDCKYHTVLPDPDPNDSFNSDDVALICTHPKCPKGEQADYVKRRGWDKLGKVITFAERPYNIPKEKVPEFCPLLPRDRYTKFIKSWKRNRYLIEMRGEKRVPILHSIEDIRTKSILDEHWNNVIALLLSYLGNRYSPSNHKDWVNKEYKYHFGDNFKQGPVGEYLGWIADVAGDVIDIQWDNITYIGAEHINNDGVFERVELPDVVKEFPNEDEFLKTLEEAHQEAHKQYLSQCGGVRRSYGRWLEPWELKTVREVLSQQVISRQGQELRWDKEDLNRLFYVNDDISFAVLGDESTHRRSLIDRLVKTRHQATDKSGKAYTGFKPETLSAIERALSNFPESTREFTMDILKSYHEDDTRLQKWQVECLYDMATLVDRLEGTIDGSGPCGISGINICELDPDIDIDNLSEDDDRVKGLIEIDKDYIIKTSIGKTYILHEAD